MIQNRRPSHNVGPGYFIHEQQVQSSELSLPIKSPEQAWTHIHINIHLFPQDVFLRCIHTDIISVFVHLFIDSFSFSITSTKVKDCSLSYCLLCCLHLEQRLAHDRHLINQSFTSLFKLKVEIISKSDEKILFIIVTIAKVSIFVTECYSFHPYGLSSWKESCSLKGKWEVQFAENISFILSKRNQGLLSLG